MDTIIERVKGVLSDPMIGEPSLEYFKMVETDLCNRNLATVQHLDLELKTFEFLAAEHKTALASLNDCKEATLSSLTDSYMEFLLWAPRVLMCYVCSTLKI